MLRIHRAWRRATARRLARIDHETLRAMDDLLLRDIGVTRATLREAIGRHRVTI